MSTTHRPHAPAWAALAALALASAACAAQAQTGTTTGTTTGSSAASGTYAGDPNAYSLLPYTRRGYVGINLGQSDFDTSCGSGLFNCERSKRAVSVYTGGFFNDWLGAEVGYLNTGRADRGGGSTRAQGLNLSAVLRAPLGPFNAFLKAGAVYGETRVSSATLSNVAEGKRRGWGGSYGAGLGFDFTPNQGVVLEWQRHQFLFPGAGREDVDTTSLGYVYRF